MQSDILRKKLGGGDYTNDLCDYLAWLESQLDQLPAQEVSASSPRQWQGGAPDPRPLCTRCGLRWVPREGQDATETPCDSCKALESEARLVASRAERDVWSGKACEEEQAAGNGPCGACRFCLPKLLTAAEKIRDKRDLEILGWVRRHEAEQYARQQADDYCSEMAGERDAAKSELVAAKIIHSDSIDALQKELAKERARLIPEEERRKLEGDALQAHNEVLQHREYTQKLLKAALALCEEIDPNEVDLKGTDLEWIESCRASVERFAHSNLAKRAEAAESDAAKFKAALASLRDSDSWGDKPLREDDAIQAAHPLRTGKHDVYAEAARLVGAKRSKRALIDLVNWLLNGATTGFAEQLKTAEAAVQDERRERQRFERWFEEQRVRAEKADAALIAERGGWEAREAAVANPLLNRLQEAAARIAELERLVDCVCNNRDQHKQWLDDITSALHPHWEEKTGKTYLPGQLADIARGVVRELNAAKGKLEQAERVIEAAQMVRKGNVIQAFLKMYQALDEIEAE
jgi:hypothetical protein